MPAPAISQQIETDDQLHLTRYAWMPVVPPQATVLIVHGYADYSERYEHLAHVLVQAGLAVFAYDMRGHGRSDGRRAYVERFELLVADLATVHSEVTSTFSNLPSFLLAHSMGTTVALNYVIDFHPSLTGLITSGATLAPVPDIPPILVSLSGILGALLPHLPTIRLDSNALSHDPGVGEAYRNDPLVFSGGMPARTGAEINKTFAYLQPRLNQIETPLLILHGTGDRLVDPASSRFLADLAASEDKTLKLYDGLFHEIFNEPEKDQVFQDIIAWITDRL